MVTKKPWEKSQDGSVAKLVGTRYEYLATLYKAREMHIGALARELDKDGADVSRAVSELTRSKFVEVDVRGNRKYCSLAENGKRVVEFYEGLVSSRPEKKRFEDASYEQISFLLPRLESPDELVRVQSLKELVKLARKERISQFPSVWSILEVLTDPARKPMWLQVLEILDGIANVCEGLNDQKALKRLQKSTDVIAHVAAEPYAEIRARRMAVKIMTEWLSPSRLYRKVSLLLRRAIKDPSESEWDSFLFAFRHALRELNQEKPQQMRELRFGLLEQSEDLVRARATKLASLFG